MFFLQENTFSDCPNFMTFFHCFMRIIKLKFYFILFLKSITMHTSLQMTTVESICRKAHRTTKFVCYYISVHLLHQDACY